MAPILGLLFEDDSLDTQIPLQERWDPNRVRDGAGRQSVTITPLPGALHVGSGQAFTSIGAAVAAARDDGVVVVHDGIYRESLRGGRGLSAGGYLSRRITIQAAPGASPTVSGADIFTDWRAAGSGLWYTPFISPFPQPGPDTIAPDQITAAHPYAGYAEQVFVDNRVMTQTGSAAQVRNSNRHFYYDVDAERLYIGVDPAGLRVELSTRSRAAYLAAAGITIRGLRFTRFSPNHRDGKASIVIDAAGALLEDVEVTNSAATGIMVAARNTTLRRVSARWNGALGTQAFRADGLRVEFSRFDNNNIESFDYNDCGNGANCILAGMKISTTDDIVVRYSSFTNNRSTGFWCDLGCSNAIVVGNFVSGNAKHGIYYEVSHNASIVSNVLVDHEAAGAAGLKVSGSANVKVQHNTFYNNSAAVIAASDPRNPWPVAGSDIRNVDVRANVFAEPRSAADRAQQFVLQPVNESGTPLADRLRSFDRNAYLLTPARADGRPIRFRWSGNVTYSEPRQFSAATRGRFASNGQIKRAIRPATLFSSPDTGDYRLRSNISGFDPAGGVSVAAEVIGTDRIFPSTIQALENQTRTGALFID